MDKKIKIMLVTSKSLTLNTFFKDFIKTCENYSHEIELMTTDTKNIEIKNLKPNQIFLPNKLIDFFNFFKLFVFFYKNYKIIKRKKKFIFFLNTPLASHFIRIIALFLNIKIVYFVHGFRFHPNGNYFLNIFYKILETILSIPTNYYIVINNHDRNFVKKLKKKHVLINGVGLSDHYFQRNIKKFKKKNIIIGVIAAYRSNKGYDEIINVARLFKNNKNFSFICYGYDNPLKYINKSRKIGLNNIIFNNFTNNIQKEIANFDIFLHLSKREGLSVSVLQCMKMGVPTIASDIRGIKDIIQDKYNGFLVNSKSSEEIKNIITKLDSDNELYKKISYNSIISINNEYRSSHISDIILKKIIKFYDID